VTALFDVDPAVVGEEIRGLKVHHMDEIAALRAADRPDIGVITTPGWAAQGVADLLVRAGVTSLLNFAPRVLTVPPTVYLRYVDLSIELQVLGFYRARQEELQRGGAAAAQRGAVIRSVGLSRGADLE
jgi:redox-sensing transcriptional repressor